MSQNEELQPCRFCGGEGKETTYSGAPTIFCQGCNAMMGGEESRATEQDLRDDWNRSPWRTIDSAPKDGTRIIVACTDGVSIISQWVNGWGWPQLRIQQMATHWMPIPPLPEVKP